MADREKVKLGLECCHMAHLDCDNCPYDIENDSNAAAIGRMLYEEAGIDGDWADEYCMICLHHDALELLKAPEPRLYSFDETIHLPADTMLWLEEVDEPDGAIIPTAYTGASFRGDPAEISDSDVIYVCFYGRIMNTCDGYNRYWRCWTAKPTDEQRKAAKWDAYQRIGT